MQILETLIEENDGDPVTWHLLGLAYYSGHNYTEAQEIVDKGKVLLAKYGIPADDELATLFEELQTAITEALALQGGSGADAAGDAAGAK